MWRMEVLEQPPRQSPLQRTSSKGLRLPERALRKRVTEEGGSYIAMDAPVLAPNAVSEPEWMKSASASAVAPAGVPDLALLRKTERNEVAGHPMGIVPMSPLPELGRVRRSISALEYIRHRRLMSTSFNIPVDPVGTASAASGPSSKGVFGEPHQEREGCISTIRRDGSPLRGPVPPTQRPQWNRGHPLLDNYTAQQEHATQVARDLVCQALDHLSNRRAADDHVACKQGSAARKPLHPSVQPPAYAWSVKISEGTRLDGVHQTAPYGDPPVVDTSQGSSCHSGWSSSSSGYPEYVNGTSPDTWERSGQQMADEWTSKSSVSEISMPWDTAFAAPAPLPAPALVNEPGGGCRTGTLEGTHVGPCGPLGVLPWGHILWAKLAICTHCLAHTPVSNLNRAVPTWRAV
eukprot:jgi/Botrbrau1/21724/Bobra.43_1s0118.1